ncbi:hypothetical protein OUZ56_033783 [Daphnia magna]|uniref:Uncharacterized protein n=1 Tax=Daphnia magna TaxID=35525 RepID=A0ABR0BB37_9CRUS|nr:hypothetical protein OUZ56_033783 [Daphnia magna]
MMGLWSSNAMKGFLGVSCSAVTCDYVPFTAFLALHEMQKNPTAAAVFAEYESVIEDWEINKKVREKVRILPMKEVRIYRTLIRHQQL